MDSQQKHSTYKFQVVVNIVFHKVVDPAVITHPPVVLTSEMVDVYADTPLNYANRQLLNFKCTNIMVQAGFFSKFVTLFV